MAPSIETRIKSSVVSGLIEVCCTHPLDFAKTILQNEKGKRKQAFQDFLKQPYNGVSSRIVGIVPSKYSNIPVFCSPTLTLYYSVADKTLCDFDCLCCRFYANLTLITPIFCSPTLTLYYSVAGKALCDSDCLCCRFLCYYYYSHNPILGSSHLDCVLQCESCSGIALLISKKKAIILLWQEYTQHAFRHPLTFQLNKSKPKRC